MSTAVSNIDDLLTGSTSPSIPVTPESKNDDVPRSSDAPENDFDNQEPEQSDDFYLTPEEKSKNVSRETLDESEGENAEKKESDEYGNEKPKPRVYTEDEVRERINKAVRERMARGNHQEAQSTSQQVTKQAQDFEYDPESTETWQAQLEQFVEKTVSKMGQKQAERQQLQRDIKIQKEFEEKFTNSMERFSDFRDIVSAQPITDPMTYALREMNDPAAFIYAASKRHPAELQRISNLASPNAQMIEMGKLEERMRKTAPTSNAPKPVSRTREDGAMPIKSKNKESSIDDLLAQSDAKRQAQLNQKRRR